MERNLNRELASQICSRISVELVRSGARHIVVDDGVFAFARDATTANPARLYRPGGFRTSASIPSSLSFREFIDCLRGANMQTRARALLWQTHLGSATFDGMVFLTFRDKDSLCECTAVANPMPKFVNKAVHRLFLSLVRQTRSKAISQVGMRLSSTYREITDRMAMTMFRLGWA